MVNLHIVNIGPFREPKEKVHFVYTAPEESSMVAMDWYASFGTPFTAKGFLELDKSHLQQELTNIQEALQRLQPLHHLAFQMVVPYETRTVKAALKSIFFPLTTRVVERQGCHGIRASFTVVADLVTLAARVVTVLPRIWQQRNPKPIHLTHLAGHEIIMLRGSHSDIDWSRGVLKIDCPSDPKDTFCKSTMIYLLGQHIG
jgi:hypothetical protein